MNLNSDYAFGFNVELSNAAIGKQAANLLPWFDVENRQSKNLHIIFGHWAALAGKSDDIAVIALDTGCCYGNCLTAFRLEDKQRFSVKYTTK